MIYNRDISNGIPCSATLFEFESTKVSHMIFNKMIDGYESPFESLKISDISWIPFEYSLLILNSGNMIIDDRILIDIPSKKFVDYIYDIAKNSEKYTFDWAKDFGYTDSNVRILGGSSSIVNRFNGLLTYDSAAWSNLFLQFVGSSASYDDKYGENLALLLCTVSDKELQEMSNKVNMIGDLLSPDSSLGKALSSTSVQLDSKVGDWHKQCESVLEQVRNGNESLVSYNKSYQALEKAFDKQTWFSRTGGNILDRQKEISKSLGKTLDLLTVCSVIMEYNGMIFILKRIDYLETI